MALGADRSAQPARQRGLALLMVLLIVSLLVVLVLEVSAQARLNLRRVENSRESARAYYIALSGIEGAKLLLGEDLATSRSDHLQESWARPLGPYPVGDGQVSVRIVSADGRLNLNNLVRRDGTVDEEFSGIVRALYRELNLNPDLVDAVIDWIDADEVATGAGGAESDYYSGLTSPYRSKNGRLDSLQELLAVRGFDEKILARVQPFVSVLPPPALLNVNTAPREVLAALNPGLDEGEVSAVVNARDGAPFETVQALLALPQLQRHPWPVKWLTTVSRYFYVTAAARLGRVSFSMPVLLDRVAQPMRVLASG
jgi:general secretion pathway protein K